MLVGATLVRGSNSNMLKEIISDADSRNDGQIDFSEFASFMSRRCWLRDFDPCDEIMQACKQCDEGDTGLISGAEFRQAMAQLKVTDEEFKRSLAPVSLLLLTDRSYMLSSST